MVRIQSVPIHFNIWFLIFFSRLHLLLLFCIRFTTLSYIVWVYLCYFFWYSSKKKFDIAHWESTNRIANGICIKHRRRNTTLELKRAAEIFNVWPSFGVALPRNRIILISTVSSSLLSLSFSLPLQIQMRMKDFNSLIMFLKQTIENWYLFGARR